MTSFGIARLACRILALYFLLSLIQPLFIFASLLMTKGDASQQGMVGFQVAYSLGSVIAFGAISASLWIFSDRIAKVMVGRADEKIENSHATVEDLATIAFAGIGFYILSSAIPNLLRVASYYFYEASLIRREVGLVFTEVVRAVIGVYLILRPRGFAKIVHEFQEFGLKEKLAPVEKP